MSSVLQSALDIEKERQALVRIHDRLLTTARDSIEKVLDNLLPKLIALADNPELIGNVVEIVNFANSRLSEWQLTISIQNIIGLIGSRRTEGATCELPYSSKLAVDVVDAAIRNIPKESYQSCLDPLIAALDTVPIFSSQSDSICNYAIKLIEELADTGPKCLNNHPKAMQVLGDFFLDISIVQGAIEKTGKASCQTGISPKRLDRLTAKQSWSAHDMRTIKLALIRSLSKPWLPPEYCTAIAIAASLDSDEIVAAEAVYRVKGARVLFELSSISSVTTMNLLLGLCSSFVGEGSVVDGIYALERTPLRPELTASILHFLKGEILPIVSWDSASIHSILNFFLSVNCCRSIFHEETSQPQTFDGSALRILASILSTMDAFHELQYGKCESNMKIEYKKLSENSSFTVRELQLLGESKANVRNEQLFQLQMADSASFVYVSKNFLVAVGTILKNFIRHRFVFSSTKSMVPFIGTVLFHISKIIDRSILLTPHLLIKFPLNEIVGIMLEMLSQYSNFSNYSQDNDSDRKSAVATINEKDEYFVAAVKASSSSGFHDGVTSLLGTLGALRQLYIEAVDADALRQDILSSIGDNKNLKDVLLQCLSSANAKCKMLAITYMRLLLRWTPFTLEIMIKLESSAEVIIASAAREELASLRLSLSSLPVEITEQLQLLDIAIPSNEYLKQKIPYSKQLTAVEWGEVVCTSLKELSNACFVLSQSTEQQNAQIAANRSIKQILLILTEVFTKICKTISFDVNVIGSVFKQFTAQQIEAFNIFCRILREWELETVINRLPIICEKGSDDCKVLMIKFLELLLVGQGFTADQSKWTSLIVSARETILPSMLGLVGLQSIDLEVQKSIGYIVGCLLFSQQSSSTTAIASEFDAIVQNCRILKLKLKQDQEIITRNVLGPTGSTVGAALFALNRIVLALLSNYKCNSVSVTSELSTAQSAADSQINSLTAAKSTELTFALHLLQEFMDQLMFFLSVTNEHIGLQKGKIIAAQVSCIFLSSIHNWFNESMEVVTAAESSADSRKRKLDGLTTEIVVGTDNVSSTIKESSSKLSDMLTELLLKANFNRTDSSKSIPQIDEMLQGTYEVVNAVPSVVQALLATGKTQQATVIYNFFISQELWKQNLTNKGRFCITEALQKLLAVLPKDLMTASPSLLQVTTSACLNGSRNEKAFAVVFLLVLGKSKLLSMYLNGSSRSVSDNTALLLQLSQLLLTCLKENDVFVQDICCLALYHLYQESLYLDSNTAPLQGDSLPLSEKISIEVISTLTRDKRKLAPGGIALAGETVSTSAEGDAARTIAGILNNNFGGDRSSTAEQSSSTRTPSEVPDRDELLAAAATAASQLGMTPEEIAEAARRLASGNNNNNNNTNNATDLGIFGIYSAACKVSKKSGDSSIVFYVLASIQRDPSFSSTSDVSNSQNNEVGNIYSRYAPPRLVIPIEKLKPIIPMLYMYRHELSAVIRDIMKSLWQTLVVEERREYLTRTMQVEIIKYLALNMTSKLWRERFSAATAMEQLFNNQLSHSWTVMKPSIEQIWDSGFYMLDDIRDDCRIAALQLMKTLAESCLRVCDRSLGAQQYNEQYAIEAVHFLVPKMLSKGLLATCAEGKGFSLGVLNRIIKASRELLGEFRPALLSVLIECMSAFEPQMLQYMQFHTSRLSISDEELERIRLKLATESPMQEALEICLSNLDESCVVECLRSVTRQLTNGVGLATRVAAVRAISSIGEYFGEKISNELVSPFSAMVDISLQSSKAAITLRQALTGAIGSLAKIVNMSKLEAVLEQQLELFKKSDRHMITNEDESVMIASVVRQIICRAGDRITSKQLWIAVLSCAYVGSFENRSTNFSSSSSSSSSSESSSSESHSSKVLWEQTWVDGLISSGIGTKSAALQAALPSILLMICAMLRDLSWHRRLQAIEAITDLIKSLSAQQFASNIGSVVLHLLRLIQPRIWTGQHEVLLAIVAILNKCPQRCFPFNSMLPLDSSLYGAVLAVNANSFVSIQQDVELSVCSNLRVLSINNFPQMISTFEDTSVSSDTNKANMEPELEDSDVSAGAETPTALSNWVINSDAFIQILLKETTRGSAEYKLQAARALTSMPWQIVYPAAVSNRRRLESVVLNSMLDTIGASKSCLASIEQQAATTLSQQQVVVVPSAVSTTISAVPAKPISGTSQVPQKSVIQSTVNSKAAAAKKSFEMFGNRYGGPTSSKAVSTSTVVRKVVAAPKPVSLNSSDSTSSSSSSSSSSSYSSSLPSARSESASVGSLSSIDNHDNFFKQLADIIAAENPTNAEPAFRKQMMDCIKQAWSAIDMTSAEDNGATLIALTFWCLTVIRREVWSLKRAALSLLSEVLASISMEQLRNYPHCKSLFLLSFKTIYSAFEDNKYMKVKIASIQCLKRLLESHPILQYLRQQPDISSLIGPWIESSQPQQPQHQHSSGSHAQSQSQSASVSASEASATNSEADVALADLWQKIRSLWKQ